MISFASKMKFQKEMAQKFLVFFFQRIRHQQWQQMTLCLGMSWPEIFGSVETVFIFSIEKSPPMFSCDSKGAWFLRHRSTHFDLAT